MTSETIKPMAPADTREDRRDNARGAEVNRQVREWRYGPNLPTPFMVGK